MAVSRRSVDLAGFWRRRGAVRGSREIVEADKTYVLQNRKGVRSLGRTARRRRSREKKHGLSREQVPLLMATDRSRATFWHGACQGRRDGHDGRPRTGGRRCGNGFGAIIERRRRAAATVFGERTSCAPTMAQPAATRLDSCPSRPLGCGPSPKSGKVRFADEEWQQGWQADSPQRGGHRSPERTRKHSRRMTSGVGRGALAEFTCLYSEPACSGEA